MIFFTGDHFSGGKIIEKSFTFLISCCVLDDLQKTQMNSLFSELNFKISGHQLEDHCFGDLCPKPEILTSTRDFEKVTWRILEKITLIS